MSKRRLLLWLVLTLTVCTAPRKDLTIAVAANMQFAMEELVKQFEGQSGIQCATVTSSSGKLTAQIIEGAPFDMLISADLKYPEAIYQTGLTTGPPKIYAFGKLVLWSGVTGVPPSLDLLQQPQVKHVALPNQVTAPYGMAAKEVMEYHQILELLGPKLVYGESISQANQFMFTGAAEAGFTAKSVVLSPAMKGRGQWIEMDQEHYTPLAQGVVIIKNENTSHAQQFYDFLFSPEAKEIFERYGYETVVN